jgi:hypothetical protein
MHEDQKQDQRQRHREQAPSHIEKFNAGCIGDIPIHRNLKPSKNLSPNTDFNCGRELARDAFDLAFDLHAQISQATQNATWVRAGTQAVWSGSSRMDAARGALGHGWPFRADPRNIAGVQGSLTKSDPNQEQDPLAALETERGVSFPSNSTKSKQVWR